MTNIFAEQFIPSLKQELDHLSNQKATGELTLSYQKETKTIFLLAGRLQYITDSEHRVRHWQRAMATVCSHWNLPDRVINSQPWEYDFLYQGVSQRVISLEEAKSIITLVTKECFLELALEKEIELKWVVKERAKSAFSYFLSLAPPEIHPILTETEQIRDEWLREGLQPLKPQLAPILLEKGKTIIKNPLQLKYLNGNFTIWDIAFKSKQSVQVVAKSLKGWEEKGLIEFKPIRDLNIKIKEAEVKTTPVAVKESPPVTQNIAATKSQLSPPVRETNLRKNSEYLIACIDDSQIILLNLKKILQSAGFRVLCINEPMAGFAQLIEHKPDLIFLDLNMPNANGYSVCKFLRESPVFEKTPIIILTAQDRTIDRAKAKLVGASDFINKPPEPEALINLINYHLATAQKQKVK